MLATIVAVVLVSAHNAAAQAVVFVSVGEPSKDTVRLLAPYLDEMSHHAGVVALPRDFRASLGTRVSRSGRADPGLQVSDLVRMYEDGFAHFRHNQWKDAATKLGVAVATLRDNASLLVDATSHRDTWVRGLVALAMSRHRLGDKAGEDEANEDLARTYPNQTILIQALSGSEATRYYATALARLEARGRGRLIVEAREQMARVYLDADDQAQSGVLEAEVLPGLHRVLVRMPGTDGQAYDAVVEPGKTTTLAIDLKLGEALSITDRYAGLVFSSQPDRDRYGLDYAAQLAAAVNSGPEMILVERTTWNGQPAFRSVLYMADSGAWVRGRVISLDGRGDDDRMRALARATFQTRIEDARVVELPDPALRSLVRATRGWPKWTAGGGSAVLLVAGGSLLYLHQTCGPDGDPCRSESPTLAYASLGAGAALGIVAAYLFFSDRSGPQALRVGLQPTRGGVVLGLSLGY
ncbi:MAG: hypothetical protein E6J90_35425 [Deltaproteobacteria bacterium]|nr:MAG: hypothetical protein E6J91_39620 [Deltaproteobacteria bacterium]TMQ11052.1 MAG: hypothetical protein E6J90_35425 [Deltaproteobacteria bacterium]